MHTEAYALQVMREGIRMHNGYEINTEGDSFHIAFLDIVEAINFCMEIQYRCGCSSIDHMTGCCSE